MNEKQLKQLADLLLSFGFEIKEVEQNITNIDNSAKGKVKVVYTSHFSYTPKLSLKEES